MNIGIGEKINLKSQEFYVWFKVDNMFWFQYSIRHTIIQRLFNVAHSTKVQVDLYPKIQR